MTDRQPLVRTQGQDEELGLLLLHTMSSTWAGGGRQFNRERRALHRRWARLVRVLAEYQVGGSSAPWSVRDLEAWLQVVRVPTAHWLPAPPIPAAERVESDRRLELIRQFSAELIREEGLAFPTPDDIAALAALGKWQVEALPSRAPYRTSSRSVVCKYLQEIGRFAVRWRLAAWWAVPGMVHEHLMNARFGHFRLDLRVPPARDVDRYRLVAKVPLHSDEQFKEDVARLDTVMLEQTQNAYGGPVRALRPPSREELARIEQREDAASVIVDWDPGRESNPAEYVQREIEHRLGRTLVDAEKREVRRQIDPQIRAARDWFTERSWQSTTRANREAQARAVAYRLLNPSKTWQDLAESLDALETRDANRSPRDPAMFSRSCSSFAAAAKLRLPNYGRGPRSAAKDCQIIPPTP